MQRCRSVRSKYHLLGVVGRGQFGRVLCAIRKLTGEVVALKELHADRAPTVVFLRELRFLATLDHPHIVSWQGYEHFHEGRFLVMDYCDGGNLRHLLNWHECLPIDRVLQFGEELLQGLSHAHSRGVIHCDLKPENILLNLTAGASSWQTRLSDFGIACMSHESSQKLESMHGSPAYMAPERAYGEISIAVDIYSVGILLYELLLGHRPFSGSPGDLMQAHRHQAVFIPPELPPLLRSLLQTALEKQPENRFASASEMLVALQKVKAPPPTPISSITPATTPATILPRSILMIDPTSVMAIELAGRWKADLPIHRLNVCTIQGKTILPAYPTHRRLLTTRQHLLALDRRHLLLLFQRSGETGWTIYNRRGNCLYEFLTPFDVAQIVKSPHGYHLAAIETDNPQALLLIDLKPLQLRRIPLPISADWIAAADWGYLVTDRSGTIVLVDLWGQIICQQATHVVPTAIGLADAGQLIMVQGSQLFQFDLQPFLPNAGVK
jgi:eukaryotic-like serine/threonine-protein kinase